MKHVILRFAALLVACLITSQGVAQEIWLGVRGPDVGAGAAADWNDLFKPTPEWSAVASKIQVFVISAGYVVQTPDAELKAAMSDLERRHITLTLGMQSVGIEPVDNCGHEEGYGQPEYSAKAAEKLYRLGIPLQTIVLDEPIWFGHYEPSGDGCRFKVEELARRVALNVSAYLKYFPDLSVGDVEPIPAINRESDWKSAFDTFAQDLSHLTGKPLSFLQTDVSWRNPSYIEALRDTAKFAQAKRLKFGIIYKGDGADKTGEAWVKDAIERFDKTESETGLVPDQASFATWEPHPRHVLPETSNSTLSHVLAEYTLSRTKIVGTEGDARVGGWLKTANGVPIAGATVRLVSVGAGDSQVPSVHKISGSVPANAKFAIIGMRINTECLCSGFNDLIAGDPLYREYAGGEVEHRYGLVAEVAARKGKIWNGAQVTALKMGSEDLARLVVKPDQKFGFNSDIFSVTPGAKFDFQVPLSSAIENGIFGQATLIWLDADKKGLSRTNIYIGLDEHAIGSTSTNREGMFQFNDISSRADRKLLKVEFDGDGQHRASSLLLH